MNKLMNMMQYIYWIVYVYKLIHKIYEIIIYNLLIIKIVCFVIKIIYSFL